MTKLEKDYDRQKRNALRRGIPFHIVFEDWVHIWCASGQLHNRGKSRGQYVMARIDDLGPYAIDNVHIITSGQNHLERCDSPERGAKRSGGMKRYISSLTDEEKAERKARLLRSRGLSI